MRRRSHQPERVRVMGGLSSVSASRAVLAGALALFTGAALCACDTVSEKDAPMATNERSQAITQKGPAPVSTPATIPVAATQPSASKKPRTLCPGKQDDSHSFPSKKKLSRAAGKDATPLPESLLIGS